MSRTGRVDLGTLALTAVTLTTFASNSLLTRLALGSGEIDAATFTSVRLGAGAIALAIIVRIRTGSWTPSRGRGPIGPLALIAYAVPFSFAYVRLGTATGALVLFGVVQVIMVGVGWIQGHRPTSLEYAGLVLASIGLLSLTLPSATSPDPTGLLLMATAGIAWGVYSLAGRASGDPIGANAWSFLWSSPLAIVLNVALHDSLIAHVRGLTLALVCGAGTTALGYVIWYRALPRLSVTQAAAAQLSVPVIAALGAILLLDEGLSLHTLVSGAAILGGVGLALAR